MHYPCLYTPGPCMLPLGMLPGVLFVLGAQPCVAGALVVLFLLSSLDACLIFRSIAEGPVFGGDIFSSMLAFLWFVHFRGLC